MRSRLPRMREIWRLRSTHCCDCDCSRRTGRSRCLRSPRGGFAPPCGRARPAGGSRPPRSAAAARRAPDRRPRRGRSRRAGLRGAVQTWALIGLAGRRRRARGRAARAARECGRSDAERRDSSRPASAPNRGIKRESIVASNCRPRGCASKKRVKGVENVNRNRRDSALYTLLPRDATGLCNVRAAVWQFHRISARRFHTMPDTMMPAPTNTSSRAARRRTSSRRTRSAECAGSRAGSPRSRRRRAAHW